jgi:hypothetical protein
LNDGDAISVQVTSNAPCVTVPEVASNVLTMHINIVGINELPDRVLSMQFYPNPTRNDITIKGVFQALGNENVDIELQTILGQKLLQEHVQTYQSQLEHKLHIPASVANGTYLIRLKFKDGSYVQKVVIER